MQAPVSEVAKGKWLGILGKLGLTEAQLSGKGAPCPLCGGKDRFRLDNLDGRGTWICSQCGAGDGVGLVSLVQSVDFPAAADWVREAVEGVAATASVEKVDAKRARQMCLQMWVNAEPVSDDNAAGRYLTARLGPYKSYPEVLRCAKLHFGGLIFDGLIAKVVAPDGSGVTLHRTFLDGVHSKTDLIPDPKRLMPGKLVEGSAIRLFKQAPHIGIAEGIETALAAARLNKMPVWSCISAVGIERFIPPEGIKEITVFADNDENGQGQLSAFKLKRRLSDRGVWVNVDYPPTVGWDWADVLKERLDPQSA